MQVPRQGHQVHEGVEQQKTSVGHAGNVSQHTRLAMSATFGLKLPLSSRGERRGRKMLGSNASQDIARLHKMRESLSVHKLLLVLRYCPLSVLELAAIITIILDIISLTSQSTSYISVIIATLLTVTTVKMSQGLRSTAFQSSRKQQGAPDVGTPLIRDI